MVKFRDGEAKRLQELTLNSRAAIKALGDKHKKVIKCRVRVRVRVRVLEGRWGGLVRHQEAGKLIICIMACALRSSPSQSLSVEGGNLLPPATKPPKGVSSL
jgi:hypothetical protein